MNNTCSPVFLLITIACLIPAIVNAQTSAYYIQSPTLLPVESHFVVPANDGPLTFSQANNYTLQPTYSQPLTFSQSNMYSQAVTFSQANMYSQPLTFSQANKYSTPPTYSLPQTYSQSYTAPQPSITFGGAQSTAIPSWIPAAPVDVVTPELPVFSAPSESPSAMPTHTVACNT